MRRTHNSTYTYLWKKRIKLLTSIIVLALLLPFAGQLVPIFALYEKGVNGNTRAIDAVGDVSEEREQTTIQATDESNTQAVVSAESQEGVPKVMDVVPATAVIIPSLEKLTSLTANDGGEGWNYNAANKQLKITGANNTYTLQNKDNGAQASQAVEINITVESSANNSTIIFNNINIRNSILLGNNYYNYEATGVAPFRNFALLEIIVAPNTVNAIEGANPNYKVGVYAGMATYSSYLGISGTGTLNISKGGINFWGTNSVSQATNSIVIGGATININTFINNSVDAFSGAGIGYGGLNQGYISKALGIEINSGTIDVVGYNGAAGIGGGRVYASVSGSYLGHGAITITITGGHIKRAEGYGGAGIGLGLLRNGVGAEGEINDLTINISGGTFDLIKSSSSNVDTNVPNEGSAIGYGSRGEMTKDFTMGALVIDITGGNLQSVEGVVGIGMDDLAGKPSSGSINIAKATNSNLKLNINASKYGLNMLNSGEQKITIDQVNELIIIVAGNNSSEATIKNGSSTNTALINLDLSQTTGTGWNDSNDKTIRVIDLAGNILMPDFTIPATAKYVTYVIPGQANVIETNVMAKATNNSDFGYFVRQGTENKIIASAKSFTVIKVDFLMEIALLPLWTIINGNQDIPFGIGWEYINDSANDGGVLRITAPGEYILRNNEVGDDFQPAVPIQIIVEQSAQGSTLIMDNMDIVRPKIAESTTLSPPEPELIAPFLILAKETQIILSPNSDNKIDGFDHKFAGAGYRASMLLYANETSDSYQLNITGLVNEDGEYPYLTTINGGINALGVSNSKLEMYLQNGNYNMEATGGNIAPSYGSGFGSGYSGTYTGHNFIFQIENSHREVPMAVTIISGTNIAIGSNLWNSNTNSSLKGNFKFTAYALNNKIVPANIDITNKAVTGKINVNNNDNWENMLLFFDGNDDYKHWEIPLPSENLIVNSKEDDYQLFFVHVDPEISEMATDKGFSRIAHRITRNNQILHLVNLDGTGSTTLLNDNNNELIYSSLTPEEVVYELALPKIILVNNSDSRRLTMPELTSIDIINTTKVPLRLGYRGYKLTDTPADIDDITFLSKETEFIPEGPNKQIFLNLQIETNNNEKFVFLPMETAVSLVPGAEIALEDRLLAVLRGETSEQAKINLDINGKYSDALSDYLGTRNFNSTVYLRWELLNFAEFAS